MEKYKLRNGDIWDVEDENKKAFLLQNPGAIQMDYIPNTPTSTQTDTTRFEVGEGILNTIKRRLKVFII